MNLLEQAKQVPIRHPKKAEMTEDHIALALAWARGEITYRQACTVLDIASGSFQHFIAKALTQAIREGKCCNGHGGAV